MGRMSVKDGLKERVNDTLTSGLPVKIAGIVFWGMVLVGLVIAFIVLKGRENELGARNANETKILARELTEHIDDNLLATSQFKNVRSNLQHIVETLRPGLHFEAVEVQSGNDALLIGRKHPDQESISQTLRLHSQKASAPDYTVQLRVFFPSLKKTIADYRKNVLISIGLLVLTFGLILQQILQRMLSRPFLSMVAAAESFSDGNAASRFDETRGDEFGFLAKFINRALDSIVQQQADLRNALTRATQSEAELFREKERAEVTLKSIADAVITTNSGTEVQYLNPVAERLTGWTQRRGARLAFGKRDQHRA